MNPRVGGWFVPAAAFLAVTLLLALSAPASLAGVSPGLMDPGSGQGTRLDDVMLALAAPLRLVGIGAYRATALVAAGVVAAAVLLTWLVARRVGLDAARARQCGLLLLLTPAALRAGTKHAPHCLHLLAGAAATLLAVHVAQATRTRSIAALLAVLLAVLLGWQVGSSIGALLPLVALPFWWRSLPPGAGLSLRKSWPGIVVLAACTLEAIVLRAWWPWSEYPAFGAAAAYDLATLVPLALRDGVRAFLPVSLLLLVAVASRTSHRVALALLAAALPHLLLGCHLTDTLGDDGWFLLPLLPATVLMLAQWLGRRAWLATGVAALVLASLHTYVRFDHTAANAFVRGAADTAGGAPFVLIPGPSEQEGWALAHLRDHAIFRLAPACAGPDAGAAAAATAPLLAAARSGTRVLIADNAFQALIEPLFRAHHAGAPHVLRALQAEFVWRAVRSGSFVGHELVPR